MLGVKQVYPGRYEPELLCRLIKEEKVTFSHCVPTILQMVLAAPGAQGHDFGGLKMIIGGSALNRSLYEVAKARGIQLTAAYGMSETCPLLTLAILKPHMLKWSEADQIKMRCRTGLPVANVLLEVRDAMGRALPHDGKSTGEVVVRAPWLTQGYLKDQEKSEALWQDGWLHTGDIGFIDPEGYLQITDRLKDVIKTGGEWISSLELEDIISQHPAVSEVAVIGVPDEKWGERPMALVVPKPDHKGTITEASIKSFVAKYAEDGVIPKYGVPDRISIVDALAKTSVGKLNKKEMRKQVAG